MILCQRASQNINLTYSVIKFLRYEGFVWQGDSLPFQAHSLGELTHAEITLKNQLGERQSGLRWDQGQLFGDFRAEDTYDLQLRLEYRAPFFLDEILTDFDCIHPYQYELSIDFSAGFFMSTDPRVKLSLGELSRSYEVKAQEEQAPGGHRIIMTQDGSDLGFSVHHQSPIPFGHNHFPRIQLNG